MPGNRAAGAGALRSMDSDALASPQPNVMGSGSLAALPVRFWLAAVAVAAGAGLASGLLMRLLKFVERIAWGLRTGESFLDAVRRTSQIERIVPLLVAGGLSAVAVAALRRRSSGGHSGDVAERIWFHDGRLPLVSSATKAVLSIVVVGLGASLGREASAKQAGGLIASLVGKFGRLPASQRRLLVACGVAAGIAGVYNVPLGAALFAMEVLLGSLSLTIAPPLLASGMIGAAASWLLLPDQPTYRTPPYPMSAGLLVFAVLAGPVLGVISAGYIRLIARADAWKPSASWAPAAPIVVLGLLGMAGAVRPELLGNGKDVTQAALAGALAWPLALLLCAAKPLATAACLGSGTPGGLFTPTITLGATVGLALGSGWLRLWSGAPEGAFALVGATAVLAASTQGPISALAMMLELSGRLDQTVVPCALAVAGATAVARRLEPRSIYSARIHSGRAAADGAHGPTISAAARLAELARVLAAHPGDPARVIDAQGAEVGCVEDAAVSRPPRDAFPLEVATAADFARPCDHGTGSVGRH